MARQSRTVITEQTEETGPELFDGTPGPLAPEVQEWIDQNMTEFISVPSVGKPLHVKLSEIYRTVGRIAKTGQAPTSMGGFKFVEAANVAEVIRDELAARRITMMPVEMDLVESADKATRGGNTMTLQTWRVRWMFVDGESGETYSIVSVGQGADTSDKAAPKAQTNAMKYAMLMAFLIPTGDDPERVDPENDAPQGGPINITASNIPNIKPGGRQGEITAAQFDAIRSRAKELNLDPLAMKQVIESAHPDDDFSLPTWPAGGSIDEQRDAVLTYISKTTFDDAAAILAALHGGFPFAE